MRRIAVKQVENSGGILFISPLHDAMPAGTKVFFNCMGVSAQAILLEDCQEGATHIKVELVRN